MVTVVTAPEKIEFPVGSIRIFLSGGIQKCREWQKELIDMFKHLNIDTDIYLINPRRDNFPIDDLNAAEEQITWEFDMLEECDFFTMFFDNSDSDQPICFYELGRNIERMKQKFHKIWQNNIIITCDKNFKRVQDVVIQTRLATNGKVDVGVYDSEDVIKKHFEKIIENLG